MPSVFIVGQDYSIEQMFIRAGWNLVNTIDDFTDLIQFTGGADVDPSYYGETRHAATQSKPSRDAAEAAIYNEWVLTVPMAGICRGAQFLNVMNGGKLWQHVTKHAISATHKAFCLDKKESLEVTSTHHQMMIPAMDATVLMTADLRGQKSTALETVVNSDEDCEAVYYPVTATLCYQPHPEYVSADHPCQEKYFEYLAEYLGVK